MPGAFDFFGRFETSLRTYNKDARPLPECPHGVHSPEECGCDRHHECKKPHCANDIPLDPLCKLSQGTPFGVPVSMWGYHKCFSGGCDSTDTIRGPSAISGEVTERLYSTPTRSFTAKLRSGSVSVRSVSTVAHDDLGETSDDSSGACLTEKSLEESTGSPSSSLDCKDGTNFVSHIITANPPGNHNQSRNDGISLSPSRRSVSARGRRTVFHQRTSEANNTCRRSQSSCAAPSMKPRLGFDRNGGRLNESDVTTSSEPPSSPDASPATTPALTPRQLLSPKNNVSSAQTRPVGSTPRAAVIRPSAVFAGGRYKVKPVPLNKSASDGVERLRGSFRRGKCDGVVNAKNETAPATVPLKDRQVIVDPFLRSHLARFSSDSRVDELLTQAHMVLETLTPEQDASVRSHRSPDVPGSPVLQPVRKMSGESYKDLASIICKKMEEMTLALARSEEQVAAALLEAERVWLVHRGGFCAARLLGDDASPAPPLGKLALKLEHSGDVIHVDEDDVEKANPSQFDRCEDLSSLRHLNESSVLHTLRQRYGCNLIHTYAGASMAIINPTTPLAIYSEKVIQMFRGCRQEEMPPHIYSVGQAAYREMVSTRRDQSIVFLGRSGAGKTTNFRHVLHYLALATPSCNSLLTVERLNAISTLLEAFGNSRTLLNTNATRFTQIFSLDYDHTGQIASASIQRYSHILSEPNLFMTPLQRTEDKQKAGIAWARIRAALDVLGVKEGEQRALWRVLAAIYHLGVAGVTTHGAAHKAQFARPASADVAAALLGSTIEELTRAIFLPAHQAPQPRSSFRSSSPLDRAGGRGHKQLEGLEALEGMAAGLYLFSLVIPPDDCAGYCRSSSPLDRAGGRGHKQLEGLEALEGMAAGLYAEAFNAVVTLMNRCISGSAKTVNSILVVDTPGLQNPASCGRTSGASFGDLCHNYTQERLQMLCHDTTFTAQADRYAQEHVECGDVSEALGTPAPLIALIDKPATNSVVRTSQQDLREADRRGLLWLLDEEAIFPGATDQSFLERLFAHYAERDHEAMLQKGPAPDQLVLQHFQGTSPVLYSAQGWLRASRENPVLRQAPILLQES
ncbi:unconventional myosin-XVIIIa-like, partial [Hyalella azteca]|uniref:Unconventional myosin-XVIIIa-like n=1 Tax=Hyalella azteca TaxID=294128 RepID=A0A979FQR1_HYAAZ